MDTAQDPLTPAAPNDLFGIHKKVREVAGLYNKKITNILVDNAGKTIINEREILEIWSKNVIELF